MKLNNQSKHSTALIFLLLIVVFVDRGSECKAWDYGDGRHGSFVLTTNGTIEQLYHQVRLASDPPEYDPLNTNAIPNFKNVTITNGAKLTANPWDGLVGGRIALKVQATLSIASDSSISANGLGYRGGSSAQQGESFLRKQTTSSSANYGGVGAGGPVGSSNGQPIYAPGGGGGYGETGASGLWFGVNGGSPNKGGKGGSIYGTALLDAIYLGSGGGGGIGRGTLIGGNGGGSPSFVFSPTGNSPPLRIATDPINNDTAGTTPKTTSEPTFFGMVWNYLTGRKP